jgi:hypothetical protein
VVTATDAGFCRAEPMAEVCGTARPGRLPMVYRFEISAVHWSGGRHCAAIIGSTVSPACLLAEMPGPSPIPTRASRTRRHSPQLLEPTLSGSLRCRYRPSAAAVHLGQRGGCACSVQGRSRFHRPGGKRLKAPDKPTEVRNDRSSSRNVASPRSHPGPVGSEHVVGRGCGLLLACCRLSVTGCYSRNPTGVFQEKSFCLTLSPGPILPGRRNARPGPRGFTSVRDAALATSKFRALAGWGCGASHSRNIIIPLRCVFRVGHMVVREGQ